MIDFEIAHGTFAKRDGLVVDIWNSGTGIYLFDCSFFSDYTEENERLFIGGLQVFYFISIHHIRLKEDYKAFIRPMIILSNMFIGFPFEISAVKPIDVTCLSLLILNYLSLSFSSKMSKIPVYISTFFANFVNNIEEIEINMYNINNHLEDKQYKQFGYKLLKPLFFISNGNFLSKKETVNFSKLLQIFKRKLKTIMVYNIRSVREGWKQSIYLNGLFVTEILNAISIIKKSVILSSIFERFLIIEPYNNIKNFIKKNQNKFGKVGWNLNCIQYKHPKRGKICHNCLEIAPISV